MSTTAVIDPSFLHISLPMTKQTFTLDEFWLSIEEAWAAVPDAAGAAAARGVLADPAVSPEARVEAAAKLDTQSSAFLDALRQKLNTYSSPTLIAWDAHIERLLYAIDREEVHEALDGSDDGFLYARGFVVAAGRKYYEMVDKTPSLAVMDAEEESICYLASHLHDERWVDVLLLTLALTAGRQRRVSRARQPRTQMGGHRLRCMFLDQNV